MYVNPRLWEPLCRRDELGGRDTGGDVVRDGEASPDDVRRSLALIR